MSDDQDTNSPRVRGPYAKTGITELDEIMRTLGGGWRGLDGRDDKGAAEAEKERLESVRLEIAGDVFSTFSTPQGARVLNWLYQETMGRPSWLGDVMRSQDEIATYGLWREGGNAVFRAICQAIQYISPDFQLTEKDHVQGTKPLRRRIARWLRRLARRVEG